MAGSWLGAIGLVIATHLKIPVDGDIVMRLGLFPCPPSCGIHCIGSCDFQLYSAFLTEYIVVRIIAFILGFLIGWGVQTLITLCLNVHRKN